MAQVNKTRRLASVAVGSLVVAAALGTGAFALWSDSNLVDRAAIETGDLEVNANKHALVGYDDLHARRDWVMHALGR